MDKDQFIIIVISTIYLIGVTIAYAIMENPKDKFLNGIASMGAVLWPIVLAYSIYAILTYPFYWITKKIKNKLKH